MSKTGPVKPKKSLFKPGQSGNPGGRPKIPADVKEVRQLHKNEFTRILNKFTAMTFDELKAKLEDPKTPAMELMVGKILAAAIKHGDHMRLSFLLDRMIGKVVDVVELDATVDVDVNYTTEWGKLPGGDGK